jgi:serine/threonine protein kinase
MNYILISELGKGATSTVWMSMHKMLKTHFALKVLDKDLFYDKKSKSLFLDHARSSANLSRHRNIVQVSNLVDSEDMAAIVMEKVEGKSIRNLIENTPNQEYKTILNWISQICAAVQSCHDQNYYQLNLCPSSILVEKDGNIKITPNNAAEILKSCSTAEAPMGNRIQSEAIAFCSPESFLPVGMSGKTKDIYSIGLVVFFSVIGKDPFDLNCNSIAELRSRIYNDSLPLTGTGWDVFLQKACAKNPSDRFQSIHELLANLPNEATAKQNVAVPVSNPILKKENKPVGAPIVNTESKPAFIDTNKAKTSIKKRKNIFIVFSIVAALAVLSGAAFLIFQKSINTEQPSSLESISVKYKCRNAECAGMPLYDAPGGCDLCGRELVADNSETGAEATAKQDDPNDSNNNSPLETESDSRKKPSLTEKKQRLETITVDTIASNPDPGEENKRKRNRSRDKSLVKCSFSQCDNMTSNTNLIYDHPYKPFCSERCRQKFLN